MVVRIGRLASIFMFAAMIGNSLVAMDPDQERVDKKTQLASLAVAIPSLRETISGGALSPRSPKLSKTLRKQTPPIDSIDQDFRSGKEYEARKDAIIRSSDHVIKRDKVRKERKQTKRYQEEYIKEVTDAKR